MILKAYIQITLTNMKSYSIKLTYLIQRGSTGKIEKKKEEAGLDRE